MGQRAVGEANGERKMDGPSARTILAASYTHIGVILWGSEKWRKVCEEEVARLCRHPNLQLGWETEGYAFDYLAKEEPDFLQALRGWLEEFGERLDIVASTYGQPLSAFIGEESNIRQLVYGRATAERALGRKQRYYLMSEHAFHPQLPQLLRQAGFEGAVFRTHFMMYGFCPEVDATVVNWRALDGTGIAAIPTYYGQARTRSLIGHVLPGVVTTPDNRVMTDAISERCMYGLDTMRDWVGEKVDPIVATRDDDCRSEESLVRYHEGDPALRWANLPAVFDALPQAERDFAPGASEYRARMPWGYAGGWIWRETRRVESLLLSAERLAALAALAGAGLDEDQLDLDDAWRALLAAQHHDIQICGLEDEAKRLLGRAREKGQQVAERYLEQGEAFNPLSETRVVEGGHGELVEARGLGVLSHGKEPTEAPGNGAASMEWDSGTRLLRTPLYEVQFGRGGGMRSWLERETGARLISEADKSGTLVGLIDGRWRESRAEELGCEVSNTVAVVREAGSIGGIPYRMSWRFSDRHRHVEWEAEAMFDDQRIGRPKNPECRKAPEDTSATRADRAPGFDNHEYKLRLRFFPFLGPRAEGHCDGPFFHAASPEPYLHSNCWAAVSDGERGMALLNRGIMGAMRESDGAFSAILAFSQPYIWNTMEDNSSSWRLRGNRKFEMAVLPLAGKVDGQELWRQAAEYNFPLVKPLGTDMGNGRPVDWPRLEVKAEGVRMTALFPEKGRVFARFFCDQPTTGEVAICKDGAALALRPVDFVGRPIGRSARRQSLPAWRVQTFELEDWKR